MLGKLYFNPEPSSNMKFISNKDKICLRVELIVDLLDNWTQDSIIKIRKNNKYFYERSFTNCKGSLSPKECASQLKNVCRNSHPDAIGKDLILDFELKNPRKEEFFLDLTIGKDRSEEPNQQQQEKNDEVLDFALGVYSLFVYMKKCHN